MDYAKLFDAFFTFGLIGWGVMAVLFILSVSYAIRQFSSGNSAKMILGAAIVLMLGIFSASAAGFFFLKNQTVKSEGRPDTKAVVERTK